ncbi:MAG: GntR family transcriptional regulator [Alphaproteobacteria bacterium]
MTLATARYRVIARGLAEDITAGRYRPGAHLPTEAELCKRYAASRFTVRQALAALRANGQITSRAGIGTIVTSVEPQRAFVETLATVDDILRHGYAPFVVDRINDVVADAALAERLGVKTGQALMRIEGMRYHKLAAKRVPFAWGEIHVVAAYGAIRPRLKNLDRPIASLIADMFGTMPVTIDQEIQATVMPSALARALEARPRSPALHVLRRYRDAEGEPYEIARSIYPADRFIYRNTLTSAR